MGILSSLLPGVRELRAPFASGVLWLAVAYFAAPGAFESLVDAPAVATALGALGSTGIAASALLAGCAYLLGLTAQGVVVPASELLGIVLLRFGQWIASKRTRLSADRRRAPNRRPEWFFRLVQRLELHVWPLTVAGRTLLIDAIQSRLARAGVPGSASNMYPFESLLANLRFSAAQLAITAPAQFQEYDRLRSEVEFRVALAPPLVILAALLPAAPRLAILTFSTFAAIMFLIQAIKSTRAANNLLANAAYLEQLKLPALEGLATELEKLESKPVSTGQWIAEIVMALHRIGLFEEETALLSEASFLDVEADWRDVLQHLPSGSNQRAEFARRIAERGTQPSLDLPAILRREES